MKKRKRKLFYLSTKGYWIPWSGELDVCRLREKLSRWTFWCGHVSNDLCRSMRSGYESPWDKRIKRLVISLYHREKAIRRRRSLGGKARGFRGSPRKLSTWDEGFYLCLQQLSAARRNGEYHGQIRNWDGWIYNKIRNWRQRVSIMGGPTRIRTKELRDLLERQQYKCALTGWELRPETASADHIVPIARGGEHHIENVQIIHEDANRAKGTMTNEEFVSLCKRVAFHNRRKGSPEKD